jgi:hypothetical protein
LVGSYRFVLLSLFLASASTFFQVEIIMPNLIKNIFGGIVMEKMSLKLLFSVFMIFIMFFAFLIFEIFPVESAYAMGWGGGGGGKSKRGGGGPFISSKNSNKDSKVTIDEQSGEIIKFGEYNFVKGDNAGTVHTPEPATLLLLGTGVVGLAALRKRKKK